MKIVQRFVLLLYFFCIFPSAIGASGTDLFIDTTEPIPSAWETVNSAIVLRQRPVLIQFEMLDPDHYEQLDLNFFEDVHLSVVLDHLEENGPDGSAWIGSVVSDSGGTATFVFTDNQLTGTVRLNSLAYQVRHIEGELHLVREIRLPQSVVNSMAALTGPSGEETEVVNLVNLEREINNLHPLQYDSLLYAAALGHSQDMAQQNYFNHTSLDGRTPGTRISQAGYSWNTYGENIAAGYSTPQAVMEGWMKSPGHRANILRSSFCDIGVGYAYSSASSFRNYWTQDFGRKKNVSACSSIQEYTISASAGLHGNISPAGTVTVAQGGSRTFTITADPGYRIADVFVDGQSVGARQQYTFSNVTTNHTIEASFDIIVNQEYSILAVTGLHGSISPVGTVTVLSGGSRTFTITADPGYRIAEVIVDGQSVGAPKQYTFRNVTANHKIEAYFEIIEIQEYTISASAGVHGSISPAGTVTVLSGGSRTFTITADPGYRIADVIVDGQAVGASQRYTFSNVNANHTIEAHFEIIDIQEYTISASAGSNGTITPSGTVNVVPGRSVMFSIKADPGYRVMDVIVDGRSLGPRFWYIFSNVNDDHSIEAVFERSMNRGRFAPWIRLLLDK